VTAEIGGLGLRVQLRENLDEAVIGHPDGIRDDVSLDSRPWAAAVRSIRTAGSQPDDAMGAAFQVTVGGAVDPPGQFDHPGGRGIAGHALQGQDPQHG
jgi:hypothetical protein